MQPERVCGCESHTYALVGPLPAVRSAYSPEWPLLHPCLYTMHKADSALKRVPANAEGLCLLETQPPGIWKRAAACFQCAAPHPISGACSNLPSSPCTHGDMTLWCGVAAVSYRSQPRGRYATQSVFTLPYGECMTPPQANCTASQLLAYLTSGQVLVTCLLQPCQASLHMQYTCARIFQLDSSAGPTLLALRCMRYAHNTRQPSMPAVAGCARTSLHAIHATPVDSEVC
jgi:hypothetical protein